MIEVMQLEQTLARWLPVASSRPADMPEPKPPAQTGSTGEARTGELGSNQPLYRQLLNRFAAAPALPAMSDLAAAMNTGALTTGWHTT